MFETKLKTIRCISIATKRFIKIFDRKFKQLKLRAFFMSEFHCKKPGVHGN